MKFIVFAVLALIAVVLIVGIVIGTLFELIGLGIMALLIVAAVTFIMKKVRGPRHRLQVSRARDVERLPR